MPRRPSGHGIHLEGAGSLKGLGDDIHLIGGEPHAASTAGNITDESRENINSCLKARLGFSLVQLLKLFTGEVDTRQDIITDGTIKEGYPKPDLIWTTHLCNQHSKWYQEVSRRLGGIPMFAVDMIGGGNAEKDSKIVNYVSNQIELGIDWLQRVTGRSIRMSCSPRQYGTRSRCWFLWGTYAL